MTLKEKIKDYILKNPEEKGNAAIGLKFSTSHKYVQEIRSDLRRAGLVPIFDGIPHNKKKVEEVVDKKISETSFKGDENSAEYSFKTSFRIRTKEDLIKACEIDLEEWYIERWVCNKWESAMKTPAIGGSKEGWTRTNDKPVVTPLFQIKLWLKPKVTIKEKTLLDAVEELVKEFIKEDKAGIRQTELRGKKAIKATISDMHVGLEPNPGGKSIFNYQYGEKQFNDNLDKVYNSLIKERLTHGKFDILIIDDLGDGLDGWNNTTTRGGHKLEQNMDNVQQFKVYVAGKLRLIENLIKADMSNKIIIRNVTNDNHGGDFGHIANIAIEMVLGRLYDKEFVDFYILTKFIEHFEYGEHTFILTHGKDKQYMFKGLPLDLNDKAVSFINDYIHHYKIKSKYIHVEKGDLHQLAFKKNKNFDYRNYMSFAPPSGYVQNNFGDTYSGYSIQVIPKDNGEISHTDYFFDLDVKN